MNQRVCTPPSLEQQLKTASPLGQSGETLLTVAMSEVCSNEEDASVVSDITLDAAFRLTDSEQLPCCGAAADLPFVVGRNQNVPGHHRQAAAAEGCSAPQHGKLKSSFCNKNPSEGLTQEDTALKQTLKEKKIVAERASGPAPSLDSLASVNISIAIPSDDERQNERLRKPRLSMRGESKDIDEEVQLVPDTHPRGPKVPRDNGEKTEKRRRRRSSHSRASRPRKGNENNGYVLLGPIESSRTGMPLHQVADFLASDNHDKQPTSHSERGEPNHTTSPANPKGLAGESGTKETKRKTKHRSRRSTSSAAVRSTSNSNLDAKQPTEKAKFAIKEISVHANEQRPTQNVPTDIIKISKHRRGRSVSSTRSAQPKEEQQTVATESRLQVKKPKSKRRQRKSTSPKRSTRTPTMRREPPTDIPKSINVVGDDFLQFPDLDDIDKKDPSTLRKRRHLAHRSPKPEDTDMNKSSPVTKVDKDEEKKSTEDESSSYGRWITTEKEGRTVDKSPPTLDTGFATVRRSQERRGQHLDPKPQEPQDDLVEVHREPPPPIPSMRRSKSTSDAERPLVVDEPPCDNEGTRAPGTKDGASMDQKASNKFAMKTIWKRLSERSVTSLKSERLNRASKERLVQTTVEDNRVHCNPSVPRDVSFSSVEGSRNSPSPFSYSSERSLLSSRGRGSGRSLATPPPKTSSQPARKHYSPTLVHNTNETMSYSERVMQGKIGISTLKPTPEGATVSDF